MTSDNCIFCKNYESWKTAGKIVFDGDASYSIFNVTPSVPGHAVIVPKRHVSTLGRLTSAELSSLVAVQSRTFEVIQTNLANDPQYLLSFYASLRDNPPTPASKDLAERMIKHPTLRAFPEAYNIGVNVGTSAGQTLEHIHLHLFPRTSLWRTEGIVTAMRDFLS